MFESKTVKFVTRFHVAILILQFLRLADNTDMKMVLEYNKAGWPQNYKPDIVVSFLGGCGKQLISRESEDVLKAGLYKVYRLTIFAQLIPFSNATAKAAMIQSEN